MKYLFVFCIATLCFSFSNAQVVHSPKGEEIINQDLLSKEYPLFIVSIDDKKMEFVGDKKHGNQQIFKELSPDWIERVEVIKGEKAKDQFGERGKSGVVLIELKEGSFEKMPSALSDRFAKE